jgi:iron complex transport system substrate-binding protein
VAVLLVLMLGCKAAPGPVVNAPAGGPPPERVVSLAPALTEMLFALGLGERIVGASEHSDFPPAALSITRVGGFSRPNAETILALQPDLLLVSPAPENRDTVNLLRARGLPAMVVEVRDLMQIGPALKALGEQFGVADRAQALATSIDRRLYALTALTLERAHPPTLLVVQPEPLLVCAPGSYPASLLRLAGGRNVVPRGSVRYPTFSLESVLRAAPEIIVQTGRHEANDRARDREGAGHWDRLPDLLSTRGGRVFLLEGDALLRPGPRAPEGVADLIALLHPELGAEARHIAQDPGFTPTGPIPLLGENR